MPPKHLPCFTGSVTISGPSCLPHLPDNNAKGRQRGGGGGGETEPLFQTTEFRLNLNTASFYTEPGPHGEQHTYSKRKRRDTQVLAVMQ